MSSDRSLPRPWGLGVPFLGGTHQDKHRAIREFRHLHGRPTGAAKGRPLCASSSAPQCSYTVLLEGRARREMKP